MTDQICGLKKQGQKLSWRDADLVQISDFIFEILFAGMSEKKDTQSRKRQQQQNGKKNPPCKDEPSRPSYQSPAGDQEILFSNEIQYPSNKYYQPGEIQVVTKEAHLPGRLPHINSQDNLLPQEDIQQQSNQQLELPIKAEPNPDKPNAILEPQENISQQQYEQEQAQKLEGEDSEQEGSGEEDEEDEEQSSSSPIIPAIKTMEFRKVRGERIKDMIEGKIKITDGHLSHKANQYLGYKKKKKNKKSKEHQGDQAKDQEQSESPYNYNEEDSSDQEDYIESSSGRDEFDSDFDLTDSYPGKRGRKKGSKVKKCRGRARARGRPRIQTSSDKNQKEGEQLGVKRKRGRPPKVRPQGSELPAKPKPTVVDPSLPPELGGPRRRGRPRKYPILSEQSVKEKIEQIEKQRRNNAVEKIEQKHLEISKQIKAQDSKSPEIKNEKNDHNYYLGGNFPQNMSFMSMGPMGQFMPNPMMPNINMNMFFHPFESRQMGLPMMSYERDNKSKEKEEEIESKGNH